MYPYKQRLTCPVCKTVLGFLTKNENCSFLCDECQFIYTWDHSGKLRPPMKYEPTNKEGCDCASCSWRDSHKKE